MKPQRILMQWPADDLLAALEVVIDEQGHSKLRKEIMIKKLTKLARRGQLGVENLDTEWLYRLCAASLMLHQYHWFAWEWRSEWAAKLATKPWVYPPWFGVDSAQRRILVVAEQGLGDEIVFASCYNELARDVDEAWIEVDDRLIPLFERSFPENLHFVSRFRYPAKRLIPRMSDYPEFHEGRPIEAFIMAGNIPKLYRQSVDDFPRGDASMFLTVDLERYEEMEEWLDTRYRGPWVGCSWQGRQGEIEPVPGVSLQYGVDYHKGLTEPPIDLKWDIDGVAALCAVLQRVVTTTNAVAHIAGAIGVSTECIKPPPIYATVGDAFNNRVTPWWPMDYSDWYPSIKMYRNQNEWGAKHDRNYRRAKDED